jgi:hypothetical protein
MQNFDVYSRKKACSSASYNSDIKHFQYIR